MTSTQPTPATLSSLNFSSTFTEQLPPDPIRDNKSRQVINAAFSFVSPTDPVEDDLSPVWNQALAQGQVTQQPPTIEKNLIAWSGVCAKLFDLSEEYPEGEQKDDVVEVLGGFGRLWKGMVPYAMCYGGHQFGNWAGQLGDGRAISLGEYLNSKGERWEIQLKGAGKTPYSRFSDGRAVLRSSVREFLCSEAMHSLGVPTTRALSLVGTGAGVIRDMFYSGSPMLEPGAVVSRVAPSFLRLGNFQLAAYRQDKELLTELADYAIEHHFPDLKGKNTKYHDFVKEVSMRNAKMVAHWQGIGFVHGVMNTDNFSILGLTIDYGPYGFLDEYDPDYTPNTTDIPGRRYKFETQPQVANWNIMQFCKAMVPLTSTEDMSHVVLNFEMYYEKYYYELMSKKLGVSKPKLLEDVKLLDRFLSNMQSSKADHTNTWRALSKISAQSTEAECKEWMNGLGLGENPEVEGEWQKWLDEYKKVLSEDTGYSKEERVTIMNATNPVYILRNYMAQVAIEDAERGDYSEVRRLYDVLRNPYEEQPGMETYVNRPPSWASRKGVSVNSCSS